MIISLQSGQFYQNLKETFLQKNECEHKGYLCFIRKQRINSLRKTGGNNKFKALLFT